MALREVGRRIERHYGKPQDIEWALDHEGNVLLLQSRPETVWAAKDASAPVAAENSVWPISPKRFSSAKRRAKARMVAT